MKAKEIALALIGHGCTLRADDIELMVLRHMEERLKDAGARVEALKTAIEKAMSRLEPLALKEPLEVGIATALVILLEGLEGKAEEAPPPGTGKLT